MTPHCFTASLFTLHLFTPSPFTPSLRFLHSVTLHPATLLSSRITPSLFTLMPPASSLITLHPHASSLITLLLLTLGLGRAGRKAGGRARRGRGGIKRACRCPAPSPLPPHPSYPFICSSSAFFHASLLLSPSYLSLSMLSLLSPASAHCSAACFSPFSFLPPLSFLIPTSLSPAAS
eukprot:1748987-Rhodomonas_salina.1